MKIVIFGGGGGIGSSLAFNLLRSTVDAEIVLVDTRPAMVTSHVMDLEDVLCFSRARLVRPGTPADASDADLVVITASVPLRLNNSRSSFLAENAKIILDIVGPWASPEFPGVVLMMTNPVDPLVTLLRRRYGIPTARILGYTMNDSLRFRFGVARALGACARSVEAWVIGEHGANQVPLYGRVTVDGQQVTLTSEQRASVQDYVDTWYERHVALDSGRTSTWSSGLGGALMIEAMRSGSSQPFPASVVLDGQYGVSGVSLAVPTVLGPRGIRDVAEWPLDRREEEYFFRGARHVSETLRSLHLV